MKHYNWDDIEAREGGFDNPTPGAYIAVIKRVEDAEEKEYLKVEWDFAEGKFKDNNYETFDRAGFWPITMYRSYKEKALGLFRAFLSAVEGSNAGYKFNDQRIHELEGKKLGVVLGEEGYIKSNGDHGVRLYVAQVKTLEDIRQGNFKVPAYREKADSSQINSTTAPKAGVSGGGFNELADDDGDLPF